MAIKTDTTQASPGSVGADAELARRITALRSDAFDLVGELKTTAKWGDSTELEIVCDQLQSIANQLAELQARLPTVSTPGAL